MILGFLRRESLRKLNAEADLRGDITGGWSSANDRGGRGACCHIPFAGLLSLA